MSVVFTSVERTPGKQAVVGGVLKSVREPVIAAIGERAGPHLSCDWLFTHAGLVPGAYEMRGGWTVVVPEKFTRREAPGVFRGVTLEVQHGEEKQQAHR